MGHRLLTPDPLLAETAADVVQLAIWSLLQRYGTSHLPLASFCMPDSDTSDYIKVSTSSGHQVYVCFHAGEHPKSPGVADLNPGRAPRHRAQERY